MGKEKKRLEVDKTLLRMRSAEKSSMTPTDLALRLAMNREVLMRHIRVGNVRTFKIGKRYRISEAELDRIMTVGLPEMTFEQANNGRTRKK